MLRRLTIALALAAGFAAPAAADEFVLVSPHENGVVRDREVHVVVAFPKVKQAVYQIDVRVDGLRVPHRLLSGAETYLHAVTTVAALGVHRVAVSVEGGAGSAKSGGRRMLIWKKEIKFLIADPLSIDSPEGFTARPFHDARSAKGCAGAGCHDLGLDAARPVAAGAGCRGCHKREGDFRHAPMREGACVVCHRAEGGAITALRRAEDTCFRCHDDMQARLKKAAYTHGPAQLQRCELCHDPHGAREEMLTWRGRNQTCVTCHEGFDKLPHVVAGFVSGAKGHPIAGVPDPLNAGDEFACSSCHSPHDAKHPMLYGYDQTDRTALCRMCHEDKQ